MEIEIALRKHALPHVFPRAADQLCARLPDAVTEDDRRGRTDLTRLPLVTIDGESAKDFDDAVYCEQSSGGFRLLVAIADVSHYVKHGDALDLEAHARGNSVYFPRRVIPMLPEKLSNGLCSLNPNVPRLAIVCDMQIGSDGAIRSYRFYPAVFRSHARLTYTEVGAMLDNDRSTAARRHHALLPHIQHLHRLYRLLAKARERRGAIDFETIETELIFDEHGKIARIVPVRRNDAHRVIEECMLAANVCASDFLRENDHPMLYRIHEGPTPEKLAALREFLKGFGLQLSGGDDPHARDYAKLLTRVRDRPDAQLLQTVMLRSLQQAVYSPDNVGHFGLAYESYTHFTSPIRRYPDLLVHRAIKHALTGRRPDQYAYSPHTMASLSLQCSERSRRADEAQREVDERYRAAWMEQHVGGEFDGTISGVTSFGLFVELDESKVNGLVHVTQLPHDYYQFDPVRKMLSGERRGREFRLGDRVRIVVLKASLEERKIDFRLVEDRGRVEPAPPPPRGQPAKRRKKPY
jgi:ribonuclease R